MFYLKYRPQKIDQLDNIQVKEQIKKILLSKNLPHGLLFIGQKGTGKTSTARIFAKALNCQNNDYNLNPNQLNNIEPCNQCNNCLNITNSNFPDVIELDAASNRGIEEVKKLIQETAFMPMIGKYRVFIIDEAHMITPDGFNAFLKTLEEPPKSVVFILATTNPEKLPKTIQSRLLKINFGKAKLEDILSMLKRICKNENLTYDDKFLKIISKHSDYSFRDAAKILEEVSIQKIDNLEKLEIFLGVRGKKDLLEIIAKKDIKKVFTWIDEFFQNGGNIKNLFEDLLDQLRIQLLLKRGVRIDDEKEIDLSLKEITKLIKLLLENYQLLKSTPIDSLPLEIALSEFYNEFN